MAKHMGKLQITYEMLRNVLMIDDRMKLADVYVDASRQIVNFVFESDTPVRSTSGITYTTSEGQEIPSFSIQTDAWVEKMREVVREFDKREEKERIDELTSEIKKMVAEVIANAKIRG